MILPTSQRRALIIVGHGSTMNPDSALPTWACADTIRQRALFDEVQVAFWKEEPSLRQVLHTVESEEIFVVPNFISEGYFTQKVIPRELGLPEQLAAETTTTRLPDGRLLHYCPPVGNHPRMTEVLLHRAREVAPEAPPAETSLIIVGHGTALNDNSAVAAKRQVQEIAGLGIYGEVLAAYMEEPPLVSDWVGLTTQPHVVVVPFFVADGLHSYQDIPVMLGIEPDPGEAMSRRQASRRNPHHLHGRKIYFANALGTDPLVAEVILDQVAAESTPAPAEEANQ